MSRWNARASRRLALLCAAAYFASYLTRINFAAIIPAVVQSGAADKRLAGAVTTLGFICYGAGQPLTGWLGDRLNPRRLMLAGFLVTAAMNCLLPFCSGAAMCAVWGVNGLAQAFMWPPMVKIMRTAMSTDDYNRSCVVVTWGSSLATIAVYLVSPLILLVLPWKYVFFFCAGAALVIAFVWYAGVGAAEKRGAAQPEAPARAPAAAEEACGGENAGRGLLALVMAAIFLQGILRDGVTTWLPTYVSEVFHLGSGVSILSGVVVPLFAMLSCQVTLSVYNRFGQRPLRCSMAIFLLAAAAAGVLSVFSSGSAVVVVILSALVVACMHGVNLILVTFFPAVYAKREKVAFLSGVVNLMTYVGSAVSSYGFAVLSDVCGWGGTVVSWAAVAALGAAVCFAAQKSRRRAEIPAA